jgi:hypothetical protein
MALGSPVVKGARALALLCSLLAACGSSEAEPVFTRPPATEASPAPKAAPKRSCTEIKLAAAILPDEASACATDGECRAVMLKGGCPPPLACHTFVNVTADVKKLDEAAKQLSDEYEQAGCGCAASVAECIAPGVPVCIEGRCQRAPR